MRNQLLPLAFLFLLSFITSCTNNSKNSVVGKWRPIEVDRKFMVSYGISNEDLKNMLEKESIEFTKDGKFISYSPHDSSRGIYNYDEKEKSLITAVEDGRTVNYSIELLQKNKMVLSSEFGKMTLKRN